jgi:hypothetical protein
MNATIATAVGLRLIGVLLILESLLGLLYSLFGPAEPFSSLPLGVHRRYYHLDGSIIPDFYLHDTLYMVLHFAPFLLGFLTGCILLICSKPLAKLLARNLQDV